MDRICHSTIHQKRGWLFDLLILVKLISPKFSATVFPSSDRTCYNYFMHKSFSLKYIHMTIPHWGMIFMMITLTPLWKQSKSSVKSSQSKHAQSKTKISVEGNIRPAHTSMFNNVSYMWILNAVEFSFSFPQFKVSPLLEITLLPFL
jgi:hypothetical protein